MNQKEKNLLFDLKKQEENFSKKKTTTNLDMDEKNSGRIKKKKEVFLNK